MDPANYNWKVTLSRDGSEEPAALAAFRAEPPMQYVGQPAYRQLLEHNRAARRRSDRLRATQHIRAGAWRRLRGSRGRLTTRARRTNSRLGRRASFLRLHCDRLRCWGVKNFVLEETAECETEGRTCCPDPPPDSKMADQAAFVRQRLQASHALATRSPASKK
jgi:hypothetical protein